MTLETINSEMKAEMQKYKSALKKARIVKSIDNGKYQREMDKSIQRLSELLKEKRRLQNA